MNNKELLEAKRKVKKIFDEIDKIGINTEVIENFNKLTCDKLEELADLEDNIVSDNNYLATRLYSVSYCSDTIIKSINEKLERLYKIASDINESEKVEDEH
jgi:hypothetical protein